MQNRSPGAGGIKAFIAAYPILDVEADFYTKFFEKRMFGAPMLPPWIIEAHLDAMKASPGAVVSEADPPERLQLALATVQQGRWLEFLGKEERLVPLRVMKEFAEKIKESGSEMPFVFIFHGEDDSAVPVKGSVRFVEEYRKRFGDEAVHFYTGPGEHGFDNEVALETEWLREGLEKVTGAWLE